MKGAAGDDVMVNVDSNTASASSTKRRYADASTNTDEPPVEFLPPPSSKRLKNKARALQMILDEGLDRITQLKIHFLIEKFNQLDLVEDKSQGDFSSIN